MYQSTRRTIALAAVLLVSAAACGKKDADEATTTTTAGGTVATANNNLSVGDVKLGEAIDGNKKVSDESDDFDPTDVIYASVETKGAATNATITARWMFEDGQLVDSLTQTISPTGDAATEFHISKPGGLPKGKYTLSVLVNGAEVETKEFKVD